MGMVCGMAASKSAMIEAFLKEEERTGCDYETKDCALSYSDGPIVPESRPPASRAPLDTRRAALILCPSREI